MLLDLTLPSETNAQFLIKGSMFTLTVIQVQGLHLKALSEQLTQLMQTAPNFFCYAPVIIDVHKLKNNVYCLDFAALKLILEQHKLVPVGIRGLIAELHTKAVQAGFSIWAERPLHKDSANKPSLLLTTPIRSGQQIYSHGDLTVTALVGHGAELVAHGNIHIYGILRGKAFAGKDNPEARIFCSNLEAELISIAGYYKTQTEIEPRFKGASVMIWLEDKELKIKHI